MQNLEGTLWSGIDSGGKSFVYEFLPNGVLKYTTEVGTFTKGSWNQVGYKWTWTANKISASQISGENETPELPSNSVNYDGDWKGKTSQDLEVTFTVARNGIIKMKFQAKWDGLHCSRSIETKLETSTQAIDPTAEALGNFPPVHPINKATFTLAQDTSKADGIAYTLTGTFLSPQKASGTIEYVVTSGSCQGTKKFDWTATKVPN